jgi:ribose/xylose/arabinose/galactoside ABC-type transport system permease subunit
MYIDRGREGAILVFLAVLGIVLAIFAPTFFSARNFADILINISTVTIAAVGMTAVILTGQIDISIGAQLAACATVVGLLGKAGTPLPLAFLAGIGLGMAFGLVNGFLVAYARIPSIVVTLGTMTILRALMIVLTNGSWTVLPESFRALGAGTVFGIPNPIIFTLVVLLIGNFLLSHTTWGRSLYAVGSNPAAARLAGISLERTLLSVFIFQGAMIGLTTMAFTTRFTTIEPQAGQGFEFVVITAVVLGGTNVFGGSGTVIGSFLGALLVGVINTALIFLRISVYWEQTVQGLFILLAIILDMLNRTKRFSFKNPFAKHLTRKESV